ncbi:MULTISPECIES: IDEAL domain-containing protein [Priestia]|uniref:IDEAL domain-containing protein n=1 Tax=Priestia TaxID=2800373 RepID=UPI000BF286AE|nr:MULTISPECIES: IDEAL domain-containing protein [Priestia]MBY0214902.1 IDEAL domain-containing protein [Priestia aryabhattai]MED3918044.1 IDEAL domain-containing protein [Priestia aryabhattai]MED3950159.1 IDEAL domain-containing protein [Priestia aryabhattai]MED4008911.1 IDEAL domain-containing protein [Priestia aryabhattai]NGY94096.1 IDEAL domain-containing protein [Priestia megaterium]
MEKNISNEMSQIEKNISDEILAELFLSQVTKQFKRGKILQEIDQSLKNKDKEAFLRLTDELKFVS